MLKIYIHVGPPKSGTSAIQKWLIENKKSLNSKGIYYPQHNTDKNGVSSGNLLSLFNRLPNGDLEFSTEKLALLKENTELNDCHTLILSSEFFFQKIVLLAKELPTATFLAYIRFPLEVVESSYNQGIKRHKKIEAFGVGKRPLHFQLQELINQMKVAGTQKFKLRPYLKDCFYEGDLISDFLHSVGLNPSNFAREKAKLRVNQSYTLEALEFKRWFNQFELGGVSHKMDTFLQQIDDGTKSYSLVSPDMFEHHRALFIKRLREVKEVYNIDNIDDFIVKSKDISQKKYARQYLSNHDFKTLLDRYIGAHPEDINFFIKLLVNNSSKTNEIFNRHRLKILKKRMPRKLLLRETLKKFLNNSFLFANEKK